MGSFWTSDPVHMPQLVCVLSSPCCLPSVLLWPLRLTSPPTAPWPCGASPRNGLLPSSGKLTGCMGSQAWSSPSGCRQWRPYSIQILWPQVGALWGGGEGGTGRAGIGVGCSLTSCPPGSHNACVRLWQCGEGFRQLDPLCDIPLVSGKCVSLSLPDSGGPWNELFLLFPPRGVTSEQGRFLSQIPAGTPSSFLLCPLPLRPVPPRPAPSRPVLALRVAWAEGWRPALGFVLRSWHRLENQAGLCGIDDPHWGDLWDCGRICQ